MGFGTLFAELHFAKMERVNPSRRPLGILGLGLGLLASVAACGGRASEPGPGASSAGSGAGVAAIAGAGSTSVAGSSSGGSGAGSAGSGASGAPQSAGAGSVDQTACTSSFQCRLVPASCCGCAPLNTLSNLTAINSAYENARCATVDCSSCFQPGERIPWAQFTATCDKPNNAPVGHCIAVDLGTTAITECQSATDCNLRQGSGCCPDCQGSWLAINGSQYEALSKLVCGDALPRCAGCTDSSDYSVACNEGRCAVERPLCSDANPCTE